MLEVWIATRFTTYAEKVKESILLIHSQQIAHGPIALRNLVLQPSRYCIVEIEMAPVVALGKPDHFMRGRQVTPVPLVLARLEVVRHFLFEHVAHRTGQVSDAHLRLFVIARRGNEGELG